MLTASPGLGLADEPAAPPAPAPAGKADLGADEVLLKNGGMLRGTVVAVEPEQRVIIVLPSTGENRTVPWAEVEKVQVGKYAAAGQPAGPAPQRATPPPPPPSDWGKEPISYDERTRAEEKRADGESLKTLGIVGVVVGSVLLVGGSVALGATVSACASDCAFGDVCEDPCSPGAKIGGIAGGSTGLLIGLSIIPAGIAGILEGNNRIRAAEQQLNAGVIVAPGRAGVTVGFKF